MSLENLLTQTVVILRAGSTKDPYGNANIDWSNATSTTTVGHYMPNLRVSHNNARARDEGVSDGYIFLPAGTDIRHTDRLQIDGQNFHVYGEPVNIDRPGHGPFYTEVRVRKAEG